MSAAREFEAENIPSDVHVYFYALKGIAYELLGRNADFPQEKILQKLVAVKLKQNASLEDVRTAYLESIRILSECWYSLLPDGVTSAEAVESYNQDEDLFHREKMVAAVLEVCAKWNKALNVKEPAFPLYFIRIADKEEPGLLHAPSSFTLAEMSAYEQGARERLKTPLQDAKLEAVTRTTTTMADIKSDAPPSHVPRQSFNDIFICCSALDDIIAQIAEKCPKGPALFLENALFGIVEKLRKDTLIDVNVARKTYQCNAASTSENDKHIIEMCYELILEKFIDCWKEVKKKNQWTDKKMLDYYLFESTEQDASTVFLRTVTHTLSCAAMWNLQLGIKMRTMPSGFEVRAQSAKKNLAGIQITPVSTPASSDESIKKPTTFLSDELYQVLLVGFSAGPGKNMRDYFLNPSQTKSFTLT